MASVVNAVEVVLSIFLMVAIGMLMYHLKWVDDMNLPLVSKLVVMVALPCTIASTLFSQYTPELLIESAPAIVASLLSIGVTILLALPLGKLLKLPPERFGAFVCMFSFSNSVFIGLPVSRALFGDSVTPYTLLYYIANTTLFWSIGYSLMRKYGGVLQAVSASDRIRQFFSLPLVVFFVCVVLVFLRVSPPNFMMSAFGYVGNLVTPLSLIYTGAVIMRMLKNRQVRWQKGYLFVCLGRFVIGPALFFLTALPFGLTELTRNVLLVQASMPVMAQTTIVAADTGSDVEYVAGGMALTTALSLATIPLYMLLIETVL